MTIPAWTRVPTTVWVAHRATPDPRIPAGAVVLTPDEAATWVDEPGEWLALTQLRLRGGTATAAEDAPPEIRALARRLRSRLAVGTPAALAALADTVDAPALASSLRTWPADAALTFANLSAAAAGPERRLDDTARTLLALEHL